MRFEFPKIRILLLAALLAGGCQSAHVRQPLTRTLADNDPHVRSEFWYELASRPITSNDDGFHGLLLYLDGADGCADYSARVALLRSRQMLPSDFNGAADEPLTRGTLAISLVRTLHISGGVTMRIFGPQPRYALRSLVYQGIYESCSPNQGLSGGEFVGVMQKAEEYARGNPADVPAAVMPGEMEGQNTSPVAQANRENQLRSPLPVTGDRVRVSSAFEPVESNIALSLKSPSPLPSPGVPGEGDAIPHRSAFDFDGAGFHPLVYLDDAPSTLPTSEPSAAAPKHLHAFVTGVEGDTAEVRKTENGAWEPAKVGMMVSEKAEFRTGPKSAIRFIIPPDQTFCLDCQGGMKVSEAVVNGNKMKTQLALAHGRLREDLVPIHGATTQPDEAIRIEQAGLEHDTVIESPHSALALRGTKVSLFEQESYTPEAISLTGRAFFTNTAGISVPFGGQTHTHIRGAQTSAVQQADNRASAPQSDYQARTDFEIQELSIVSQRGGFVRGDVIVGDLHESDFLSGGKYTFPGTLDFVLTWSGGPSQQLNDLNLAVFSPLNTTASPDFVANPPFTVSLNPNSAASKAKRASLYPETSRSGGRISQNSVGPDGLEVAYWGKNYPVGTYNVVVFNLLDAQPPPAKITDVVPFTVDEFLNGSKTASFSGSVGFLQTSPAIQFRVAATAASNLKPATSAPPAPHRTK